MWMKTYNRKRSKTSEMHSVVPNHNMLEMPNLGSHSRSTESGTLCMGLRDLCVLASPPGNPQACCFQRTNVAEV